MSEQATMFSSLTVPGGDFIAPTAMQEAHERLLSVFNPDNPPVVINLQSMLSDPRSEIIVVVEGTPPFNNEDWAEVTQERYLGTLSLGFMQTLTQEVAHIEHLAVDPNKRRLGLGKRLVEHAILQTHARGIKRIDLTSAETKEAAQHLYASMGFKKRDTVNWRLEYEDIGTSLWRGHLELEEKYARFSDQEPHIRITPELAQRLKSTREGRQIRYSEGL